jgi:hypothetical protein
MGIAAFWRKALWEVKMERAACLCFGRRRWHDEWGLLR